MSEKDAKDRRKRFSLIDTIRRFGRNGKTEHKKLIQNVLNWNVQNKLKELERRTQVHFVSALLNASMSSSPIIDRFISWLLAVTGAIFILAFSNLASTTTVLPEWLVIVGVIGFLITAILGFLQKLTALRLHTSIEIGTCLEKNINVLEEKHASVKEQILQDSAPGCGIDSSHKRDSEVFVASLKGVFGEHGSKKILNAFEKAISDPVSLMQSSYKQLKQQQLYALLTVVCFSITVLGLVGGVIVSLLT